MAGHRRQLRTALVTIVNADSTLQTLVGRATEIIVAWRDLDLDGTLPVIVYLVLPERQTGEDGDSRACTVQLTAIAVGNDAQEKVDDILDRCEAIVTATALDTNGINATPMRLGRSDPEEDREDSRGVTRGDLEIDVLMHQ